jgi:hypothetical protein
VNHYAYIKQQLNAALEPIGTVLMTFNIAKYNEYPYPFAYVLFGDDIETPQTDAGEQTGNYDNVLDCLIFSGYSTDTDTNDEGLLESAREEQLVAIQRIVRGLNLDHYDTGHEIIIPKNVIIRGNRPLAETDEATYGVAVVLIQIQYELLPK